jgi:hypothetical protein
VATPVGLIVWASDGRGAVVWAVGATVGAGVGNTVGAIVAAGVGSAVGNSVMASIALPHFGQNAAAGGTWFPQRAHVELEGRSSINKL